MGINLNTTFTVLLRFSGPNLMHLMLGVQTSELDGITKRHPLEGNVLDVIQDKRIFSFGLANVSPARRFPQLAPSSTSPKWNHCFGVFDGAWNSFVFL